LAIALVEPLHHKAALLSSELTKILKVAKISKNLLKSFEVTFFITQFQEIKN
jgi:hypothetical protein